MPVGRPAGAEDLVEGAAFREDETDAVEDGSAEVEPVDDAAGSDVVAGGSADEDGGGAVVAIAAPPEACSSGTARARSHQAASAPPSAASNSAAIRAGMSGWGLAGRGAERSVFD